MMLDVKGRKCVVVGGGEVAARKVETLLDCGALVTVLAPRLEPELADMVAGRKITHLNREYSKGGLDGSALAIAATDDENVNRSVYNDAVESRIPVNVVDVPELCTFIVPSIVERGDLLIAISTSGKSPAMAKRIRRELEEKFGAEYGVVLELMGEMRLLLQKREPDLGKRMQILSAIANSNLLERVRGGERPGADETLREFGLK
jgi:precorrin-2 dehydrogenase/sirohydrochlorin ferrochelatase